MSDQIKADMADLLNRPAFRRFLWRVIERGGVFAVNTSGSDGRDLSFFEGRRSLALEILADVEAGQDLKHPSGVPFAASIQTLSEELHMPQRDLEKPRDRKRDDQYRELTGDGSADE